jgi:hypothetical protein
MPLMFREMVRKEGQTSQEESDVASQPAFPHYIHTPLHISHDSYLLPVINLFGKRGLAQIPGQKLTPIHMKSAPACPSNLPQNQEDSLGYLSAPDHLVKWHSAQVQGQFLTALNIPDCAAE